MKEKPTQLSSERGEFLKPYYENPVISQEFIKAIEGGGFSAEGENITPIDYFSTPHEINEEKKEELIAHIVGIKPEQVKDQLEKFSQCLHASKDFIKDYLSQKLPKEIENLDSFGSTKDLFKFLSKTKTLKRGDKIGYSPFYCAVASTMLAIFEYKKENFQNLIKETDYLDKKLFEHDKEDGSCHFTFFRKQKDPDWSHIAVFTNNNETVPAGYSYRGKGEESGISKIIRVPELSAKEIIKDGVGLKFEVDSLEKVKSLAIFLTQYVEEKFQAEKIIISNVVEVVAERELEEIKKDLDNRAIIFSEPKNPASNKRWQALKIEGEIKLPENGEEGRMLISRNFEIQITLINNKNESGMARHEIYKRVQKLSAYTRLFGSFSEAYLDILCQEASKESGLATHNIKRYIKNNFLIKVKKAGNKSIKYASREHLERWKKAGRIPPGIEILEKLD